MKNIFTILFLLTSFLYANEVSVFDSINNIQEPPSVLKSKKLYLKYTKIPKTIYTNQRFNVTLEAIILFPQENYNTIKTSYSYEKNIELLDSNITWIKQSNNKYTTTLTFKAKSKDFRLPVITVSVKKYRTIMSNIFIGDNEVGGNNIVTQKSIIYNTLGYINIQPPKINYSNIAVNQKSFSKIIATNLIVKDIQTKQYNNSMLMVVINIQAKNSNLEEFFLGSFKEQKIEDFEQNGNIQEIFYSVIVPKHTDNINFKYYNPQTTKFIEVQLPISLEEDLISTQSDLNPQDNSLLIYKIVLLGILLIIALLIYIKTFNKLLLVFILFLLAVFINIILPNSTIIIKPNSHVYILPTNLATIYKDTNTTIKVEVLKKRNGFIKVLFDDKRVGWIKEKDAQ